MLVNANTILNYNRCRRFAALNDPFTSLYLNQGFDQVDPLFKDIFLSHIYDKNSEIKKNVNLTYEFEHEITLSENYDYIVNDKDVYCLMPNTASEFLNLKFREGTHKYQVFTKNNKGIYTARLDSKNSKNLDEKLDKLKSSFEDIGKIIFNYSLKNYILKQVYPKKSYNLRFVFLNSDYVFDGISYPEKLYHVFNFSNIKDLDEIVEIALFRMINHIELNDFTPCKLVKKACLKDKPGECKFIDFCYSHLPKNASILDYFSSHLGFNEVSDHGNTHHDVYDLLNEGLIAMQDIPISWLEKQNHLMQRFCVDNQALYFNRERIEAGLKTLKFPLLYLDFEAFPRAIPRYYGEKPYTQSVFQFSLHIEKEENSLLAIDSNHHGFIANPNKDDREVLFKKLISLLNKYDSSIIVYNKTFEKTRLEEFKMIFPTHAKEIDKIIERLFDLLDVVKMNKTFYTNLGYKEEELDSYNLYHPDLGGSYSLKKVIKIFAPEAYDNLVIKDGVKAYKAYMKIPEMSDIEIEETKKNLFLYCRQDTYSMYQIIKGLKELIGPDFTINNS